MKKYIHIAFIYAIAAMVCGVFYREFTKFHGFTGKTSLAFAHLHLFVLGAILFLVIAIFAHLTDFTEQVLFKRFMILYHIGLPFMIVMFFVRGIFQVFGTELSKGASAAISGISGIAHILVGISIVLLFLALNKGTISQSE